MYDIVDGLMKFEAGEMDEEEVLDLFQTLVNTGMAWKLQGSYGRLAVHLINNGLIHEKPETLH